MKYLLFGLGNPDEEFKKTRHNAGQILLDFVAELNIENDNAVHESIFDKLKSKEKSFYLSGHEVKLMYPGVYMNNSGGFVKKFRQPENMIIIVYDDIDLPLGEIRLSYNKSGGSHNGVLSVVKSLGTQKFITLRVGISRVDQLGKTTRVNGKGGVQNFVMSDFSQDELKKIKSIAPFAQNTLKLLIENGLEKTLSIYKSKI